MDEWSIKKGRTYRIVVSDLERDVPSGPASEAGPKPIWIASLPTWAPRKRRAYGYRDEEYMRLKILTAFLPNKLAEFTRTNMR